MSQHALLSPSGASRWLACTPSARFEEKIGVSTAGNAALEGTLAHSLCELLIGRQLGRVKQRDYEKQLKEIKANEFYDAAMLEYCEDYCVYVIEEFHKVQAHTSDALIELETKLDLTKYVPEGFGTGDVIIVADGVLRVVDLKYGKGVAVSASENKQLMIYGLGAYESFGFLYNIHTVHVTIYQPRLDSVTDFEISVTELLAWAENELRPKAKLAFEGGGEFCAGSHCRFCKAKAVCRTNRDYQMQIAVHAFKEPDTLSLEEIADLLGRLESFKIWMTAVHEHALDQAMNQGVEYPGYKIVNGKGRRVYTDEAKIREILSNKNFNEEEYLEISLLPITKLEKSIGKADFNTIVSPYIEKKEGSPTLAPVGDKREPYNKNDAASKIFSNQ